jgi:hypothetical protein
MLSQVFAAWLVTLIVLPFTAPFSTCDVPALRSHATVHSLGETGAAHALPVARPGLRVKLAISAPNTPLAQTPSAARRLVRTEAVASGLFLAPLSPPLRV